MERPLLARNALARVTCGMLVSIIIPCYQNESQLSITSERIWSAIAKHDDNLELLLIDDGSSDGTWNEIKKLAEQFEAVYGIKLKRNIGAYNAILAGFDHAKGDAIVVMAADGDDPPELISELLRNLQNNDAVLANRSGSEKGLGSVIASKAFYGMLRTVGAKNIPAGGSDFVLVRREVVERCKNEEFKSGNTLIQLVQHAQRVATVPYIKGRSKPTTWSMTKKSVLFFQTLNQFIRVPFVQSKPTAYEVETTTDR